MLLHVHKKTWTEGLKLVDFNEHEKDTEKVIKSMVELAKTYNKMVQEEGKTSREQYQLANVGKLDPKRHLETSVENLMGSKCESKHLE